MINCDWCGDEISKGKNNISHDGDNCCNGCIHDANRNAEPINTVGDLEYLSKNELIDLVSNMSFWEGEYNKGDLNEMVLHYRKNK